MRTISHRLVITIATALFQQQFTPVNDHRLFFIRMFCSELHFARLARMNANGAAPSHGQDEPRGRHLEDASGSPLSSSHRYQVDPFTSSSVTVTSHSDDALKMELYRRFHPAVAACRDYTLSSTAFAPTVPSFPTALSDLLKEPANRSCAWRCIGTVGIDGTFSVAERRALCAGLLSYAHQDREESIIPLIEIALYAADRRDMELYKAVGEVALSSGLGDSIAASTIAGFCGLKSYNAVRESAFHPWMEIFARSNSLPVYDTIARALTERVMARQPGTYDHLLRTLCMADSSRAATVLQGLVAAPLPPKSATIPKPRSLKIALGAFTPVCVGMVAAQGVVEAALALGHSEPIATAVTSALSTPRLWIISGVMGVLGGLTAISTAWVARNQLATFFDAMRDHLLGPDYHHLAERIYARLGEAAPRNRYARIVRHNMESCDAYASVMDGWRRSYPLVTSSIPSEDARSSTR